MRIVDTDSIRSAFAGATTREDLLARLDLIDEVSQDVERAPNPVDPQQWNALIRRVIHDLVTAP